MKRPRGFADLPEAFTGWKASKIAVLPVPYDRTSTWIKGADKGPLAVIRASSALELYDIETDSEVYKRGIYTCKPLDVAPAPADMARDVEGKVLELGRAGKFTVIIGGEHSVSAGAVRAHASLNKGLSVLQLDAHADLREEYEGSPYNHACFASRARESATVVQVGVRSMSVEESARVEARNMFYARDIVGRTGWVAKAVSRLKKNVYVTIDLDVFDPSIMPSTGTPEPGGLEWYAVLRLLKEVSAKKNVVGFDVVELCPNDNNKAPDFLAAKLVYKFLSYIFEAKR